MTQDDMKKAVAQLAVEQISEQLTPDSIIGVGTGTTANSFIDVLANIRHLFDGAVSSSEATCERLRARGIPVYDLNAVAGLDFYIDGADEFDSALNLVKGGGGALTREKIVAAAAKTFIGIVDTSKQVDVLGTFPLPVEVIPMAHALVARQLEKLGGEPELRQGFVTDNGNLILDVHNLQIRDPRALETELNNIVGVVTNGLFALRGADRVLMATPGGVKTLLPS